MSKHLWEVNHSYYCNESNYYQNGTGSSFATWQEFISEFGDSDKDLNLIFRWDWKLPTDDDGNLIINEDPCYRDGTLQLFLMGQRTGLYWCTEVSVCKADEPSVIEFLQPRFEHLVSLWEPLEAIKKGGE